MGAKKIDDPRGQFSLKFSLEVMFGRGMESYRATILSGAGSGELYAGLMLSWEIGSSSLNSPAISISYYCNKGTTTTRVGPLFVFGRFVTGNGGY